MMSRRNNDIHPGVLQFAARTILAGYICVSPFIAGAQDKKPAAKDPGLQHIFRNVKQADGYAYKVRIESNFPGATKPGTVQSMSSYTSHTAFVYYVSMNNEVFFMNRKGSFRVDSAARQVIYQAFATDQEREEKKQYYATALGGMLDSLFLDKGYVLRKSAGKKTITYQVAYPERHSLISLDVTARSTDYFPEKISYVMDRSLNPASPSELIRQKLTIDGYVHKMPETVQRLVSDTSSLDRQLGLLYPGYTLQKAH